MTKQLELTRTILADVSSSIWEKQSAYKALNAFCLMNDQEVPDIGLTSCEANTLLGLDVLPSDKICRELFADIDHDAYLQVISDYVTCIVFDNPVFIKPYATRLSRVIGTQRAAFLCGQTLDDFCSEYEVDFYSAPDYDFSKSTMTDYYTSYAEGCLVGEAEFIQDLARTFTPQEISNIMSIPLDKIEALSAVKLRWDEYTNQYFRVTEKG